MDPAYYVAAGSLKARSTQLEVLANNLANVNTTGFKGERTFFAVFNKARQSSRNLPYTDVVNNGTTLAGRGIDMRQGALQKTEAPLDLALEGKGFFTLQGPGGPVATRDGRFTLGPQGQLQSQDGWAVLGKNGQAIRLNPGGEAIAIGRDGTLSQGGTLVGQLDLREFADPSALRHLGQGRYDLTGAQAVPVKTTVAQGYVEQSGVDMAAAMVEMIRLNRLYEMSMKVASTLANDLDARSITDIAMQR